LSRGGLRPQFRYDLAESTAGRTVAALAADPKIFVADAAKEYGFTDIDGRYLDNFYRAAGRIA
jgi:hypothetical protein